MMVQGIMQVDGKSSCSRTADTCVDRSNCRYSTSSNKTHSRCRAARKEGKLLLYSSSGSYACCKKEVAEGRKLRQGRVDCN